MAGSSKERSLEVTPTWAVSVVCFVLVAISIAIEQFIHHLGEWLKKKHKRALYEALDKIKTELMLLGFISFLLTVGQDPITKICIPESVANSWHPCAEDEKDSDEYDDPCKEKDQVQFVSAYGIHQLHIFIFVLAVSHILYAITTLGLGRLKMRKWKAWEDETKTLEYQYDNDPERFRFARETSFGRRHMNSWSKSPVFLWIVCFLRQFLTSVAKVDYLTLRNGFITAHLAPTSLVSFDFQKYISRSLDEDFKMVVGISPVIWLLAVLCLMSYTHGWYSYYWLPFYPLIVLLLVGTKLQMIITKMGLRIQERGDIVKGTPMVQPGDDLFWFKRPRLMLFLIQFVLFQNAFQLAFFAWSWYEFGVRSCFHDRIDDILIRVSMGILTQVLCSYVTLPLYALVTQMGSKMKPVIFSDNVASALKSWHQTAKKHIKQGQVSGTTTPFWSRPPSPLHGMSPLHLLHGYQGSIAESLQASPRMSIYDNEGGSASAEGSQSPAHNNNNDNNTTAQIMQPLEGGKIMNSQPGSSSMPRSSRPLHEIEISLSDFSFVDKKFRSTETL